MSQTVSRSLSPEQLDQLAVELDAVRAREVADLGEKDARYIRRIYAAVRWTAFTGRGLIYAGIFVPWLWVAGVLLLGLSKILDNMELGHNVMHGQYDFLNDPDLNGKTFEWDIVGTSDNWRQTHNYMHHTYTNIKGVDDDVGYGVLRLFPEQRWKPMYLFQPFYSVIFALLFQWGVAIQELRLGQLFKGRKAWPKFRRELAPVAHKARYQLVKDYLVFPLLAGPHFLTVAVGNLIANGIRNVWTFSIIFCGHFTRDAEIFPKSVLKDETRGHWYYRQIRGSSNLTGGPVIDLLSGNLSHQIEHHLYPDIPAWRYSRMAPAVREICQRYGIHYNTGSFPGQAAQVTWRILRHAFPSRVRGQGKRVREPVPA